MFGRYFTDTKMWNTDGLTDRNRQIDNTNVCSLVNLGWGYKYVSKLYQSLVRSRLDNGCIIYGSARKSYLQMLDPIHNQGLRLALGAFRTSPVASLYKKQINHHYTHEERNSLYNML